MVVALLALFVAMGGTGYAALKLPKNSVGSKQIAKNAVSSSKVKDRTLLTKDFKAGQIPAGPRGLQGAQGPKGDVGAQGQQGVKGANGTAAAYAQVNGDGTVDAAHSLNVTNANVTRSQQGAYCIHDLGFAVRSMVASPTEFISSARIANVSLPGPNAGIRGCGFGVPVVVMMDSAGALQDAQFTVWVNP